jgi:cell division septum initiation protein DivIVA
MKPSFTKSVMGYNTGEVDKYVEHVSERYNSVCRENAELKRRLLSEGARLREAEERISELEKPAVTGATLDKTALVKIFEELNAEKDRFAYFIESVKDSLNDICAESEALISDDSWEDALGSYIEEVKDTTDVAADSTTVTDDEDDGFYEIDDDTDAYDAETDNVLAIFGSTASEVFDDEDDEGDSIDTNEVSDASFPIEDLADFADDVADAEDNCNGDEIVDSDDAEKDTTPVDTRTPAQIAADLDFYTDGDHADGESFDPMTLAAEITSRNSRPKMSDFVKPVPSEEN